MGEMELRILSKTSTVASQTLLGMWLFIHAGVKVNPRQRKDLWRIWYIRLMRIHVMSIMYSSQDR